MEKISLGSKILQLRKELKLTQVQLADKVGVSGAAISHFENGTSKPAPETIEKLTHVLRFDFSTIEVEPKRLKGYRSSDGLFEAALQAMSEGGWTKASNRPKDSSDVDPIHSLLSGQTIGKTIALEMYNQASFIGIVLNGEVVFSKDSPSSVGVMPLPGINYQQAVVLEVQGSSMAPRYPEGSRYVLFPVAQEHWQYATGVHAIWLKSRKLLIKRITSNKEGTIALKSDATGDQTTVEVGDIAALWRFGQAIHLPPEEL